MSEKSEFGVGKFFAMLISAVLLVFLSVIATLLIVKSMQPAQLCGYVHESHESKPLFSEKEQWVGVNRIRIPGKDVEVVRTDEDLCYIQPTPLQEKQGKARPMQIIREPLSEQMVEELASPAAVEFCNGATVYLTKEVVPEDLEHSRRRKRQETDTTYVDQRTPRCRDMILDCVESVGQTSSCHTGVNGVFYMDRTCESETTFKVYMTKPPGRILKVLQQEAKVCRIRRLKGLRC